MVTCKWCHHPSSTTSTTRHWVLLLCLCLFYAYFYALLICLQNIWIYEYLHVLMQKDTNSCFMAKIRLGRLPWDGRHIWGRWRNGIATKRQSKSGVNHNLTQAAWIVRFLLKHSWSRWCAVTLSGQNWSSGGVLCGSGSRLGPGGGGRSQFFPSPPQFATDTGNQSCPWVVALCVVWRSTVDTVQGPGPSQKFSAWINPG